MLTFGVKSNLDQLTKGFNKLASQQVPFATSLTINRILQLSRDGLLSAMKREFDRPTPYTLNSLFIKASTKSTLSGWVGHKRRDGALAASKYLRPEIEGGTRGLKSTEKFLGHYIMPAQGFRLDQYGNIPGGILRTIRQSIESGGRLANGKQYVKLEGDRAKGKRPGVYLRMPGKVKIRGRKGAKSAEQTSGAFIPVLFFSKTPHYRPRYDLKGIVYRMIDAEWGKQFSAAMDFALSTATIKV